MDDEAPMKDPVAPPHKRFVLGQASLRLWIMAACVLALAIWLFVEL